MAVEYRLTFKCDKCSLLHSYVGPFEDIFEAGKRLMKEGIQAIVIEDECKAKLDDLDKAEADAKPPFIFLGRWGK